MRLLRSDLVAQPGPLAYGAVPQRLAAAVDTVLEWRRRHRSRRQLRMLTDHMCKDIGISRADAWREGRKPFWKA